MATAVSPTAADPVAAGAQGSPVSPPAAEGPRRRGRPRKHPLVAAGAQGGPVSPLAAEGPRRRGRPRKHPLVAAGAQGGPVSPLASEHPLVAAGAPGSPVSPLAAEGPRRRGRPPKYPVAAGVAGSLLSPPAATESEAGGEYERERAARIRENMERMQKLGILDLKQNLAQSAAASRARGRPRRKPVQPGSGGAAGSRPARRSLRLKSVEPVSYCEMKPKKEKQPGSVKTKLIIEEGAKEEIYTEEHEKLLGTCNTPWTLFVDGFGKDGKRIYDQVSGQTCHQCRQKTLGHRTSCCKCQIVQGQFCGDCLYMRYGENVLEAKKNPNWVCPVCRGICNCSICRTKKGWFPTGCVYRKAVSLGYKSVAHYLIATQRAPASSGDSSSDGLNKMAANSGDSSSDGLNKTVANSGDSSSDVFNKTADDLNKTATTQLETSCISDHDDLLTKDSLEEGETSSKAKQNKETCCQVKNSDGYQDDSRSESVVTSDCQNDQANKDAHCVTPVSKPTSRKRKSVERSPDCIASRLRSRCKMP